MVKIEPSFQRLIHIQSHISEFSIPRYSTSKLSLLRLFTTYPETPVTRLAKPLDRSSHRSIPSHAHFLDPLLLLNLTREPSIPPPRYRSRQRNDEKNPLPPPPLCVYLFHEGRHFFPRGSYMAVSFSIQSYRSTSSYRVVRCRMASHRRPGAADRASITSCSRY